MPNLPAGSRNHAEDIDFKVMPIGTSDITGLLLGYPTLDSAPIGVGWSLTQHAHYFKICDQFLPRAEMVLKGKALRELREWQSKGGDSTTHNIISFQSGYSREKEGRVPWQCYIS